MKQKAGFGLADVETLECDEDATHEERAKALQRAINSGMWSLQGSYGRSMMAAIEAGDCLLGKEDCRDYYGNHIPSRSQVKEGTKGSRAFVVAQHGEAWANKMGRVA
jgi:hypothetical protein